MQQTQEHSGIYTNSFSGLDLSNSGGDIEPSSCTVFQNCDVSTDGAIVRRGGTSLVSLYNFGAGNSAKSWHCSVHTKNGTEYLIIVNDGGIVITQFFDNTLNPRDISTSSSVSKANVWTKPLTSCNFVVMSAPYDRVLILTGNHPPVEVSLLERTLDFTVAVFGPNTTAEASYSLNDYYGWFDRSAASTLVWDPVTKQSFSVITKNTGFNVTVTSNPALTAGVRRLSIASITWQWWAEAAYYIGGEFAQSVSRVNVTDLDQNVAVPAELITDYPVIRPNDVFTGLTASSQANLCSNLYSIAANPNTENLYQTTMGGRYTSVVGLPPQPAPFFVTFGARQAAGGITPLTIIRRRILPFRRGAGTKLGDLRVYVDGELSVLNTAACSSSPMGWQTWNVDVSSVATTYTLGSISTSIVHSIEPTGGQRIPSYESEIKIVDTSSKRFFGSASQTTWLFDKTVPSPIMDGRYIMAYGVGAFCDYNVGTFPTLGTVHRDRLVLSTTSTTDQLVVSASSDSMVVGEFFTFFQISEALKGDVNEPFTVNITADTRNNITAMVSWQEALLIFTSDSVFSVIAGEQFSVNSFRVSVAASYGCFNQRCVSVSELSVVYMNRYGVFDLVNKPNTSQLGVAERSSKVRPLFENLASTESDDKHWLIFDESSSLLYIGLCVNNGSLYTTRHLTLNTRFDAWATLTSSVPFQMLNPVKLYSKLCLFSLVASSQFLGVLIPNQLFYMDFAVYFNSVTWAQRGIAQNMAIPSYYTPQRIFSSELKFFPNLLDAVGTDIKKFRDVWVGNSAAPVLSNPRMTLGDNLYTSFLVGGVTSPTAWLPYSLATSQTPWNVYPQPSLVAADAGGFNLTLPQPTTVDNVLLPNVAHSRLGGAVYTSIAASKIFNFASMGRLKRLKRLHLQFDTTVVVGRKYFYANLQNCRQVNMANVAVTTDSNHIGASSGLANDRSDYSTGSSLNTTFYDTSYEAIGVKQFSIALTGSGVQYRWWISSVGAEAFKLNGYEVEVKPQREKRYQPG